jgi:signal transduction histidine kinase
MRRGPLLTIMVAGVAAVVTVSLGIMQYGRMSILLEFKAGQSKHAQSATLDLLGYLDSFDRDTRLASAIAERTRRQSTIDPQAQDQVIQAAFEAQVTVVAHYRTIALYGAPSRPPIVAVDPTEDRARIAPALVEASAPVAREALALGQPKLVGPVSVGPDRFFYLYAAPAGPGEAVVVSADAGLMFEVAGRARGGTQTMVVIDPSGSVWLGCETPASCRLLAPGSRDGLRIEELLRPPPPSERPHPYGADPSLRLPSRVVIGTAPPAESPLGRWSVALLASAAEIDARETRLLWQLLLTSAGVVVTMLTVGSLIVRQRATAAALEARLQTAQEIATLRERSERILENVPAGILGVTSDGRPAMANRFFLERIQHASEPDGSELGAWAGRLRPHIDRALASRRTQIVTDREAGVAGRDLRDYDVRIVPLDRPADDVTALVLVEDLSELHSLQRQLVRADELVTVGVLAAGIAHEVGTPLMVIRGRAEHLLERAGEGASAEALRAIIDQIDRISSTIKQVLEFSRAEPIAVGVADARRGVSRAVELLEWRLASKRLSVRQDLDQGLPPIAADPQQFEQVIINLLMNACDASPSGAAIDVRGAVDPAQGNRLRLDLVDHGSGIAPEHVNAVFDPYFTTKKRGEGTGLGLAIVARIARLHGAEVALVSKLGVGTTATVLWPLVRAEPEAALA